MTATTYQEPSTITLQVEHPVRDFDAWKRAFASDPADRRASGVRSFQVLRPLHDPAYVIVELAFSSAREAEAFLERLRPLWRRVEGTLMEHPRARILTVVQSEAY